MHQAIKEFLPKFRYTRPIAQPDWRYLCRDATDAWAWSTAAGLEHLCLADVWTDDEFVHNHYLSAFLAFQAGCRQNIAWLHHVSLLADRTQNLRAQTWTSIQLLEISANAGDQHRNVVSHDGDRIALSKGMFFPSEEAQRSSYSQEESIKWLRGQLQSKSFNYRRPQAQDAIRWIVKVLAKLRDSHCSAHATGQPAVASTMRVQQTATLNSRECVTNGRTTHCDACKAGVNWFALSGVDLESLADNKDQVNSAAQQGMEGLLLALVNVLEADAAAENCGCTDVCDTHQSTTPVSTNHWGSSTVAPGWHTSFSHGQPLVPMSTGRVEHAVYSTEKHEASIGAFRCASQTPGALQALSDESVENAVGGAASRVYGGQSASVSRGLPWQRAARVAQACLQLSAFLCSCLEQQLHTDLEAAAAVTRRLRYLEAVVEEHEDAAKSTGKPPRERPEKYAQTATCVATQRPCNWHATQPSPGTTTAALPASTAPGMMIPQRVSGTHLASRSMHTGGKLLHLRTVYTGPRYLACGSSGVRASACDPSRSGPSPHRCCTMPLLHHAAVGHPSGAPLHLLHTGTPRPIPFTEARHGSASAQPRHQGLYVVESIRQMVADVEARFAATEQEFERRMLVNAGHTSMQAGMRELFSSYNGKRVQAGQFVAPAVTQRPGHTGSETKTSWSPDAQISSAGS
eukprot:jgi/Ulvmu1/1574/UM111_0002.1